MKKVISLILSLCFILSLGVIPASAEEAIENENITILIHNEDISEETKEKLIAFYSNPEGQGNDATTYGLTCTLFGHKLESSTTTVITHKVRTTAPRCQQKMYNYESCTRCDYENSTLIGNTYINCCA
jgi:hypothetical protein